MTPWFSPQIGEVATTEDEQSSQLWNDVTGDRLSDALKICY